MAYIDLGLPSGTLWADTNEEGYYNYETAVEKYGDNLPTREQFEELQTQCQWKWNGSGYDVTGPNGNTLVLAAAGYRYCDGCVYRVDSNGCYWSSMPYDSNYVWSLYFNSSDVTIGNYNRCYGGTVRLVKKI